MSATVLITYGELANNGDQLLWVGSSVGQEAITTTGASQQSTYSATIDGIVIKVHPQGDAMRFKIGSNPTASGTSTKLAMDDIEYFCLKAGEKIAVIDA